MIGRPLTDSPSLRFLTTASCWAATGVAGAAARALAGAAGTVVVTAVSGRHHRRGGGEREG